MQRLEWKDDAIAYHKNLIATLYALEQPRSHAVVEGLASHISLLCSMDVHGLPALTVLARLLEIGGDHLAHKDLSEALSNCAMSRAADSFQHVCIGVGALQLVHVH